MAEPHRKSGHFQVDVSYSFDRLLEAKLAQAMQVSRGDEHFAIAIPAHDIRAVAVPGEPLRQPAAEGHHVGLGRPFVRSAERDPASVGRDGRRGFGPGMGREALRVAAREAGAPQVAFSDEDDRVTVYGGLAEIGGERGCCRKDGKDDCECAHGGPLWTDPPDCTG